MELATTMYGDHGSPVVVLHGLFGSGRNWMTAARRLSAGHRVVTVDLRNHGSSPWTDSMSYPEMAADVHETIGTLGLGPVALVGHSMGGKTAMLTALQHPEVVDRLVVVDVAPVEYPPAFLEYAKAMRAARLDGVRRRAEVEEQLMEAVPEPGTRAFLLQNLVLDDAGARWRPNLQAIESALPAISGWPDGGTASYQGPTLFVFGGRSRYVTPEQHATIAQLFPAARLTEIPEAGHWVHAERLDDFLAAVTPFVDESDKS
jgi:esterase